MVEKDYRVSGPVDKYLKIGLFLSAVFCLLFSVLVPIFNNGNVFRITAAVGMTVFVIFHGLHRYGWQKMSLFLVITFLVSWIFESISISTGFPFGKFYYTELLGIKAGAVPWGIMLAYFFTGYLAWTVSTIFFGEIDGGANKKNLVFLPVFAAVIMVLWNLSFDPVLSTIEGNWVWSINGVLHGVPLINSFGWFLTTYISFQLFALLIYSSKEKNQEEQRIWYWMLIPLMLFVQVIEYLIHPFLRTDHIEIYITAFWIALLGIGLISLIAIIILSVKYSKKNKETKNIV